jgi:hypothetical protein
MFDEWSRSQPPAAGLVYSKFLKNRKASSLIRKSLFDKILSTIERKN